MNDINIKTKIAAGYALILFLMVTVSTIAYKSVISLIQSVDWVEHTHEVIETGTLVGASMVDMETGKRGFLVTGIEAYLEPYNDGLKKFDIYITNGAKLTSDNRAQVARWKEVKVLKENITNLQENPRGKIKLTAPVTYGEETIVPLVNDFVLKYPELEINFHLTNQTVDLVDEGTVKDVIDHFSKGKDCEIMTMTTLEKDSISKIKAKLLSYVS